LPEEGGLIGKVACDETRCVTKLAEVTLKLPTGHHDPGVWTPLLPQLILYGLKGLILKFQALIWHDFASCPVEAHHSRVRSS
jgi:hypothetical protein